MSNAASDSWTASPSERTLQVYLLGSVDFEAALNWQRRLVYNVSGDRSNAYLLLCEHPPLITVGRQGSRAHLRWDEGQFHHRDCPIRWVNRGGGCLLHVPGQLTFYPILPLDRLGLGLQDYLDRLHATVTDLLTDFSLRPERRPERVGLWVGGRLIAAFGVAVRDWVSYYGGVVNIAPDLQPFRRISCGGADEAPMTSLARERHGPVRPALVRERFIEHFVAHFGFARTTLFFDHPAFSKKASSDVVVTPS